MTTTYSGNPASSSKDAVRFFIQDTAAPWLLQDEEIEYTLTIDADPMAAAATCARSIAMSFARLAKSKKVGDLSIDYGERSKFYQELADTLEAKGNIGGVIPYSGGISISDKINVEGNTDRVRPPFRVDQFDNPNSATTQPRRDDPWGRL